MLKRLEDAQRDGDPIFGVIRGTGVSNDGRGKGLLVPASRGQVQAMSMAYKRAAVSPETIQMVECHATGTVLGDGTELRSMTEVFNDAQTPWVGSLKGNMGHALPLPESEVCRSESFGHDGSAHRPVDTLNDTLLQEQFKLLIESRLAEWTTQTCRSLICLVVTMHTLSSKHGRMVLLFQRFERKYHQNQS